MDAWTIRYTETNGDRVHLNPMPEAEAKTLLDGVHRHLDPDAVLVYLTAEAQERLPVGARVRHVTTGQTGTVVTDDSANAPTKRGAPAGVQIAHCVSLRRVAVCVHFDGCAHSDWYDAAFIEPLDEGSVA